MPLSFIFDAFMWEVVCVCWGGSGGREGIAECIKAKKKKTSCKMWKKLKDKTDNISTFREKPKGIIYNK